MVPQGMMLIDKPKGITSFDVIRILRKKLGVRKIGHAGTLDPLATGLMILGIGDATKQLNDFLKLPKEYEVEILLGVQTTTGDAEGKIIAFAPVHHLAEQLIKETIEAMHGTWELPVPAYSAIKVRGEPLYKSARRGKVILLPVKPMTVRRAEYQDMRQEGEQIVIRTVFDVSSGTYIRSLAEEVGRRLGVPASVYSLRRTKIGDFSVSEAEQIEGEARALR